MKRSRDNNEFEKKKTQKSYDMEIFKIITEHLRQDVREFWTRANFYLLSHTALFSAFLAVYPSLINEQIFIVIMVPIFGFVLTVLWFLVLRGARFWMMQWQEQVNRLCEEVDRFKCYLEVEAHARKKLSKSPSYLTLILPLLFGIAWLTILVLVITKVIA